MPLGVKCPTIRYCLVSPFYPSKNAYRELFQIFFARGAGPSDPIIRAQSATGQVLELIPHGSFENDVPTFFVTEHAHWMNVATGEVEFRPINEAWKPSSRNWKLLYSVDGPSRMRMETTTEPSYLIDCRSDTFERISARLTPLEYSEYLTIVFQTGTATVSVDLPRFRLSFDVNETGDLECHNLPSIIVDSNQCSGTMIGLENQLVLRHKDPRFDGLPRSRRVLIPQGDVSCSVTYQKGQPQDDHVCVCIDTRENFRRRVTYHTYTINSDLGLLVNTANLTGHLYKIYLHALCSYPLPDPLTSQTGTDHALQELRSARSLSFQQLTDVDVELLSLIGNLTPRRYWDPKASRRSQATIWSSHLPSLSQHNDFDYFVREVLKHAQSLSVFADSTKSKVEYAYLKMSNDPFLTSRAKHRSAMFYEQPVGTEVQAPADTTYRSRDSEETEGDEEVLSAHEMARIIHEWRNGTSGQIGDGELFRLFRNWNRMSGPSRGLSTLSYSSRWLGLSDQRPTIWLSLYNLCRLGQDDAATRYQLVFSFPTAVYSQPSLRSMMDLFVAVATTPDFRTIAPPKSSSYTLMDGLEPSRERVRNIVHSSLRARGNTPAQDLQRLEDEDTDDYHERRRRYYLQETGQRVSRVVTALLGQTQQSAVQHSFQGDDPAWFSTDNALLELNTYWASCARNRRLLQFATDVTAALQRNLVHPTTNNRPSSLAFVPQLRLDVNQDRSDAEFKLDSVLATRSAAEILPHCERIFGDGAPSIPREHGLMVDTAPAEGLISQFEERHESLGPSICYAERLQQSVDDLRGEHQLTIPTILPALDNITAYRDQCRARLDTFLGWVHATLDVPPGDVGQLIRDVGLWPRTYSRSLLRLFASEDEIKIDHSWGPVLICLAKHIIEFQHSQRLLDFALRNEVDDFYKELDNAVFQDEDVANHPEWLLIQVSSQVLSISF